MVIFLWQVTSRSYAKMEHHTAIYQRPFEYKNNFCTYRSVQLPFALGSLHEYYDPTLVVLLLQLLQTLYFCLQLHPSCSTGAKLMAPKGEPLHDPLLHIKNHCAGQNCGDFDLKRYRNVFKFKKSIPFS